ncbi:hypothetical protein [Ralstonia flaminis]|nr:hypothetical protein [Ralstonia sp. LMG 18101]
MPATQSSIQLSAVHLGAWMPVVAVLASLSACGGGDDSASAASAPRTMSGMVAMGDLLPGAQVRVTDAQGKTLSTVSDSTGHYEIPLAGLTAPLLVTADDASGDDPTLYSVLPELPTHDDEAIVNVSIMTSALVAELSEDEDPAALGAPQVLTRRVTPISVNATIARLNSQLAPILAAAGENAASYNPIHQPYLTAPQPKGIFADILRQVAPTKGSIVGQLLPYMTCQGGATPTYATRVDFGRTVVDLASVIPSTGRVAPQGVCGNGGGAPLPF